MPTDPKTPAQRKAKARGALSDAIDEHGHGYEDNCDDDVCAIEHAIDDYASAYIAEAVAPALARIDELLTRYMGTRAEELREIRKLLTEGRGEPSRVMFPARPLSEWHEDKGPKLWWKFPVVEPPYSGSPGDDDFPDYVTHWTDIVVPNEPGQG